MNSLDYPVANKISPVFRDYGASIPLDKSDIITPTIQRENKLGISINSKLSGKIKFLLGFIYFLSLLFFIIQLLT